MGSLLNKKITLNDLLNIPYDQAIEYTVDFIKEYVKKAGVKNVVMGLSGGVDSATVLALLTEALGSDHVTVLIMPDEKVTSKQDVEDAKYLAEIFGVKQYYIPINNIMGSYKTIPFFDYDDRLATGNLRARIRMTLLYYYANKYNAIVIGTSDRSELLIGYYTKYGDGGADLLPIGALYKTQVRRLALKLGIPENIAFKPSSPGLWPHHLAEEELGLRYEDIDLVLYSVFDLGVEPDKVPSYTGIPYSVVEKVLMLHRRSRHKRVFPPIPRYPWLDQPIKEI